MGSGQDYSWGWRDVEGDAPRRLLLLDLPGLTTATLRLAEVDADACPRLAWLTGAGSSGLDQQPLRRCSARTPLDELWSTDVGNALRDLGLSFDRLGSTLRPSWRGDTAAMELLAQRPSGPADVTWLRLQDAASAARDHGLHGRGFAQAVAGTEAHIEQLIEILTLDGIPPRVWAISWGTLHSVHATRDALGSLHQVLSRRLLAKTSGVQDAGHLRIACPSGPASERVRAWLMGSPHVGRVFDVRDQPPGIHLTPGELYAEPAAGVAFGRQRLWARPNTLTETSGHSNCGDHGLIRTDGRRQPRTLRGLAARTLAVGTAMAHARWPVAATQPAATQSVEHVRSPLDLLPDVAALVHDEHTAER